MYNYIYICIYIHIVLVSVSVLVFVLAGRRACGVAAVDGAQRHINGVVSKTKDITATKNYTQRKERRTTAREARGI